MPSIPQPHYFYRSTGQGGLEFVRPVLGSFNYVVADNAYVFPRHQHLNYQLIFAQRGRYRCVLNDTTLELKPRSIDTAPMATSVGKSTVQWQYQKARARTFQDGGRTWLALESPRGVELWEIGRGS